MEWISNHGYWLLKNTWIDVIKGTSSTAYRNTTRWFLFSKYEYMQQFFIKIICSKFNYPRILHQGKSSQKLLSTPWKYFLQHSYYQVASSIPSLIKLRHAVCCSSACKWVGKAIKIHSLQLICSTFSYILKHWLVWNNRIQF